MPLKKDSHLRKIRKLILPLTRLKGVGPKRASLLAQKGLHTILDLFFFVPIRYEDRTRFTPIDLTEDGEAALVKGRVRYGREERFPRSRKRLFKMSIQDNGGSLELLWFHYRLPHLEGLADSGTELIVYGKVRMNKGQRQMIHPDIGRAGNHGYENTPGFYPVYPSIKDISGNLIRSLIRSSLDGYLGSVIDPVPRWLIDQIGLPDLIQAIRCVHLPPSDSSYERLNRFETRSHKRLLFDRFFLVMLIIAHRKRARESVSVPAFILPSGLIKDIEKFFPFRLTSDQERSIKEIAGDLSSERPMNRLLMGDVGCGKTVVAAVAAYISIRNNRQVALMAPTQILAKQHMEYLSGLAERLGFRPVLLTGDLKMTECREIYNDIRNGSSNLIIGTHSLIQENLSFRDLGLVIIDEQHRFGVRQRALLNGKGDNPHLLVMTATPIPRTLAITAYGDMDISMIKEYPEGHMPVETHLIKEEDRKWAFENLKQRLSAGQQAFVICPVIEGTEEVDLKSALEMEIRLKKALSPSFRVGIIHGRMSSDERERVMADFHKRFINLLVGTTVIEVGVHVPNATVVLIEHPERFGLAQLHQLRGRVGRGSERGVCLLILSGSLSDTALVRLEFLAQSNDGFEIAQKDLELRGHGELTGVRQAGVGELDLSEMLREPDLLAVARQEAQDLIESDPELLRPEHCQLKVLADAISGKGLNL